MFLTWIKALLIFALPLGGLVAQVSDLPPLRHTVSDETGIITLFYPETWTVEEEQNEGLRLSRRLDDGTLVHFSAVLLPTPSLSLDELADWLIEEGLVSERAAFSLQSYAGLDGWLAQGDGLGERGVFSAVAALQIQENQIVFIQSAFSSAHLRDVAPIITAMLEKMVILPAAARSESSQIQVNIPFDWVHATTPEALLVAVEEADMQALAQGQTPKGMGVMIRLVPGTLETFAANTNTVRDSLEFEANGARAMMQLRQVPGGYEIIIVRQRGADALLELRAVAALSAPLLAQVPLFQAMFTSLKLG